MIDKVYSLPEAALLWGIKRNTLQAGIIRGQYKDYEQKGLIRRSSKVWLVSEEFMNSVFGQKA